MNGSFPMVTTITVTYNSSNSINLFLDSVIDNSLVGQIIIIENNSKDRWITKRRISDYKKNSNYKKIEYIENNVNYGFGKSCNMGALRSKESYLLFINPDTQLSKNSISILVKHAIHTNANIIGGKSLTFNGDPHLTVVRKPNFNIGLFEFSNLGKLFKTQRGHRDFYYLNNQRIIRAKSDQRVDALGGAYLMIKQESFNQLNGFDENFFMYLEDVDISIRAKKLGMKVIYCPHSVIKHIGGASSDNKYKIRHQAWFDSRKYYFKKHFGILTNLVIQPLYVVEEFILKKIRKI